MRDRTRSFLRGVGETLAVCAGFLAMGFAVPAMVPGAEPAAPAYNRAPMQAAGPDDPQGRGGAQAPPLWLLDGYNVVAVGVLRGGTRSGWWGRRTRGQLLEQAARFEDPEAEIWVVFDGGRPPPEEDPAHPRVRSVFSPSADEWLVQRVRERAPDARVTVVTADRRLAARVRHHGAEVVAPGGFLARCTGP
jgi:predicted RNA-binding protein with PIN domain